MKNRYRKKYVEAIMQVISMKCRGRALPVCVDARKLLEEACNRNGLVHSYSANESYRIVRDLFEEIDRQCKGHEPDEVFPVFILKCTSKIVNTIGHGRELEVNDKWTAAFYGSNAYAGRSENYTGFVLFPQRVVNGHPILQPHRSPRRKAMQTEISKFNESVCEMHNRKLIEPETAEHSLIAPGGVTVRLIAN